MMKQEFENLTGVAVTFEEYQDIEKHYLDFDGDKQAFANAFLANGGPAKIYAARAKTIEELRNRLVEQSKEHRREVETLKKRLEAAKADMDQLLEWKPAEATGTNLNQSDYMLLALVGRKLTAAEAADLVADETGFSREQIIIIQNVTRYEVNNLHQLRAAEIYTRAPVCAATDQNYVRFNVHTNGGARQWELVNGELRPYNS